MNAVLRPRKLAMRMIATLALLAVGSAALPVSAASKPPISLPKMGKWEMNYDEDSCHLFGQFGSGDQATLLALTRNGPSDWLQMTVVSKLVDYNGIAVPVEVGIGDQPQPYNLQGVALTSAGKDGKKSPVIKVEGLRLDGWHWPDDTAASVTPPALSSLAEASVTSLTIRVARKQPIRLETGSLGEPMKAMRACTDDLLQHWGYDPKVYAGLTKRTTPTGNINKWLLSKDYPNRALIEGHNGMVSFRLDVDPTGAVTGCRVLYRTNPDDFADLSCKLLLQRARMTPALDAEGKPVKDYYIGRVRWVAGSW
jgi:TonB family protein